MSMSYLLIILVVFIALAPLISLRPSRRQRQIAGMREAAAMAGLYVELKDSPLYTADASNVFYGCRRGREHPKPAGKGVYSRDGESWIARRGTVSAPRLALLASLPPGVEAVTEDVLGVGLYWDERGDVDEVKALADTLRTLLTTP